MAPEVTARTHQPACFCSSWLPYCSYELTYSEASAIAGMGIPLTRVKGYAAATNKASSTTLGFALEQVGADAFSSRGLSGKGVKVGIIDGGFLGADESESLARFFTHGHVRFYRDYITPELPAYGGAYGLDDQHGTQVWQLIGGYHPAKKIQYGLATEATYFVARTDHGGFEKRIEEDLLIEALEDMDSMGVQLVNISLGYNIGFTDPKENYLPTQMDGHTSMLAQAVNHAATEKGMLIVVAAGNEGSLPWKTLSTPADAPHALTVGASKQSVWDKMNYSSIGPEYTSFVKPDIVVYATEGTSFAAPVVTGMAACLWQLDSSLTNLELIELFHRAGNFYPYPNNYLGYGVPTCEALLEVYHGSPRQLPDSKHTKKNSLTLSVPSSSNLTIAFHKKDDTHVLHRTVYRQKKKIKLKKPEGVTRTSVLFGQKVVEVFWEE